MNPFRAILQWTDNHSKRFTWALSQISLLFMGVILVQFIFGRFVIAGIGIVILLALGATIFLVNYRTTSRLRVK